MRMPEKRSASFDRWNDHPNSVQTGDPIRSSNFRYTSAIRQTVAAQYTDESAGATPSNGAENLMTARSGSGLNQIRSTTIKTLLASTYEERHKRLRNST